MPGVELHAAPACQSSLEDLVNCRSSLRVQASAALRCLRQAEHGGASGPAIRYHAGDFYISTQTPTRGIYLFKANDRRPWSEPTSQEAKAG